ncbi:MAG TPA: PilN domain-containing protein [Candidatus Polarisedimenticolia bacterium]|nr:PilN domain-containing protein [Candidatus Polarisedimenticolia bacterium]
MIHINLLAEAKPTKTRTLKPGLQMPGNVPQNLLMIALVALSFVFVSWKWYSLRAEHVDLADRIVKAEKEKARLDEIIKKGDMYKAQRDLLNKKITLITQLKKNQSGPVHLLDEISRKLPDFLWLDSMSGTANNVTIAGKATTYNAVSNFYNNLTGSKFFDQVVLGPIAQTPQGITFSLTCKFLPSAVPAEGDQASAGL